ncbi:hypothetical protein V1273_002807 [Bradyrhizobium sp. AZCC 1721]
MRISNLQKGPCTTAQPLRERDKAKGSQRAAIHSNMLPGDVKRQRPTAGNTIEPVLMARCLILAEAIKGCRSLRAQQHPYGGFSFSPSCDQGFTFSPGWPRQKGPVHSRGEPSCFADWDPPFVPGTTRRSNCSDHCMNDDRRGGRGADSWAVADSTLSKNVKSNQSSPITRTSRRRAFSKLVGASDGSIRTQALRLSSRLTRLGPLERHH